MVAGFATRGAGTGFIQAVPATKTQVVALGSMGRGGWDDDDNHEGGRHGGNAQTATLSFGFNELVATSASRRQSSCGTSRTSRRPSRSPTRSTREARTRCRSTTRRSRCGRVTRGTFASASTCRWPRPAARACRASRRSATCPAIVTFTPVGGSNNGVTLRVPYYMVPQGVSNVSTKIDTRQLRKTGSTTATTTNREAPSPGTADWYAWGIKDKRDRASARTTSARSARSRSRRRRGCVRDQHVSPLVECHAERVRRLRRRER